MIRNPAGSVALTVNVPTGKRGSFKVLFPVVAVGVVLILNGIAVPLGNVPGVVKERLRVLVVDPPPPPPPPPLTAPI